MAPQVFSLGIWNYVAMVNAFYCLFVFFFFVFFFFCGGGGGGVRKNAKNLIETHSLILPVYLLEQTRFDHKLFNLFYSKT